MKKCNEILDSINESEVLDEADSKKFMKDFNVRVKLLKEEVKNNTNNIYGAVDSLVNFLNSYKKTL